MKKYILSLIINVVILSVWAQPNHEEIKRIEAMKIGYLTKNLNLTTEQAEKFWPLYNAYQNEEKTIRRQIHQLMRNKPHEKSDAEMKEALEKGLSLKQKKLDLEKKYLDKFLGVISAKQVGALYRAEREFKHQMFRELRDRGKRNFKSEDDF